MLKSISASDLRMQIKRVLNEVSYGQTRYLIKKFGEPMAAIVSVDDFRLLQEIKLQRQEAFGEAENSFLVHLNEIHQALTAGGYRPRTIEEIDAQIQAERESWGA